MKQIFAVLMKLYPRDYRALFAEEMAAVFEDSRRERRSGGMGTYALFLLAEFSGLLRGAAMARGRALVPFAAGALISATLLRPFLLIGRVLPRVHAHGPTPDAVVELVELATISVVVIAGCAIAFVLNLRSLAQRRQARA